MSYYDKAIKSGRLESIILGISSAFDLFPRWQQVLPTSPSYRDPSDDQINMQADLERVVAELPKKGIGHEREQGPLRMGEEQANTCSHQRNWGLGKFPDPRIGSE